MKHIYKINKWWIITTIALYFTFWGGILFQILLGILQLISFSIYIANWSKIKPSIKSFLYIYGIITSLLIALLFSRLNESVFIVWVISGGVAFYFLYITYQQNKFLSREL
ncbi:hypothetical protein [Dokdonia sp.]|uniref:hypothetical protein n=1 Tax=Dokdonia sp. TaxID=2024995 RepID=UPI003267EA27